MANVTTKNTFSQWLEACPLKKYNVNAYRKRIGLTGLVGSFKQKLCLPVSPYSFYHASAALAKPL